VKRIDAQKIEPLLQWSSEWKLRAEARSGNRDYCDREVPSCTCGRVASEGEI
jgi:hypothetical protein